jgi:hypothetical protein
MFVLDMLTSYDAIALAPNVLDRVVPLVNRTIYPSRAVVDPQRPLNIRTSSSNSPPWRVSFLRKDETPELVNVEELSWRYIGSGFHWLESHGHGNIKT